MEELGTRLNEEMKRVQEQIEGAMELVAAEVQKAMREFQREHQAGPKPDEPKKKARRAARTAPKTYRPSSTKKKRPRRRPPGSAAAPVKPKPKPTPLKDGAEAPVD